MNLFIEAVLVGCAFIVLANLVGLGMSWFISTDTMPKDCEKWASQYTLTGNFMFFLMGFLGHLLFEWTGVNSWYCREGNACKVKQ